MLDVKFSRKFGHRFLKLVEVLVQLVILHEADWVERILEKLRCHLILYQRTAMVDHVEWYLSRGAKVVSIAELLSNEILLSHHHLEISAI